MHIKSNSMVVTAADHDKGIVDYEMKNELSKSTHKSVIYYGQEPKLKNY